MTDLGGSDELRDDEYTPSMKRIRLEYMAMSEDSGGDPDLPLLGVRFDRALEVEIARRVAEARMAGYRDGFEAGQIKAFVPMKLPVRTPKTRVTTPRCDCGHVASTHNDLGYCQARGKKNSGCHCDVFQNDDVRRVWAERKAALAVEQEVSETETGDEQ